MFGTLATRQYQILPPMKPIPLTCSAPCCPAVSQSAWSVHVVVGQRCAAQVSVRLTAPQEFDKNISLTSVHEI